MPYGTRAPKELLHHLSALILRRPCVSADPADTLPGVRGSRLLDRRPPHYRCPAVPGLKASARAILMVLGSSVLPSVINCILLVLRNAQWPDPAPLFGSQPRCPSCVFSGLEPHCRTSRCARPQLTPSPRCCSLLHCWVLRTALTGTATAYCWYCSWRPLITAGHPVRSSVSSPSCNNPGFGTPPPHRPAHCNFGYCCPAVRLCQALLSLWATRETITVPQPNVYSGRHRFSCLSRKARTSRSAQDAQSSLHSR